MKEVIEAIGAVLGASLPAAMGKPDWTYRDFPHATKEALEDAIQVIGEENIHWITRAAYPASGDRPETFRGQALISPQGMARLDAFVLGMRSA